MSAPHGRFPRIGYPTALAPGASGIRCRRNRAGATVSAPVFVVPPEVLRAGTVTVDGAEGRHAATVTRLRIGEAVELVDGLGRRGAGTVTATGSQPASDRPAQGSGSPRRRPPGPNGRAPGGGDGR